MGAVSMCARALLGRRLWGTIALIALIGIAGGAVIAATAGARRTDTAFPRLLDHVRAADVQITQNLLLFDPGNAAAERAVSARQLARLPHAARVGGVTGFALIDRDPAGRPDFRGDTSGVASDGRAFYEIERPLLDEGRMPRRDRPDEVMVDRFTADRLGLGVGDPYRVLVAKFPELADLDERLRAEGREPEDATDAELAAVLTPVDLEVTGIGRSSEEIVVGEDQADQYYAILTPAFTERYREQVIYTFAYVVLDDARNLASFEVAARRAHVDAAFSFNSRDRRTETFGTAVTPYVGALWLFALIAGLTALVVVGQAVARSVALDATEQPALRALGLRRAQMVLVVAARGLVCAFLGAMVAVALGVGLSPVFPLGVAREAEPDPGVRLDLAVTALGLVAVVVLFGACSLLVAWRRTGTPRLAASASRRAAGVELLGRLGAGPAAVTGVRYATQQDRRAGTPSPIATLVAAATAVATVGAVLVFAASLNDLVETPRAWGWNWDAVLDTFDSGVSDETLASVGDDAAIRGATVGARGDVLLDQLSVHSVGLERVRGGVVPQLLEGRFPTRRQEVALGSATLQELGRSVGDTTIATSSSGRRVRLRIVGRTVLPSLDLAASHAVGTGAAFTLDGLTALDPGVQTSFFLVDLAPNARRAAIDRRYASLGASLQPARRPADIRTYLDVRATPFVLAGLLALLGAGVLAHALTTSVGRRRHELGVLKSIGFSRRQISSTVAWQATATAGIAAVAGIVLGVVAGRGIWRVFVDDLGVSDNSTVPLLGLAALAMATIVFANAVAAVPARAAARIQPAVVLRSE